MITERWAASGAMALTGPAEGRGLGPPAPLVDMLDGLAARLAWATRTQGHRVDVDPLALLTGRAALFGFHRGGTTSCGGATRLLPTADGWMAVCLARPDDVELVPAWLELAADDLAELGDGSAPAAWWPSIASAVAPRRGAALVERAAWLGLPVAALGERVADQSDTTSAPGGAIVTALPGPRPRGRPLRGCRVVDLSALWAGPLCGQLLARAGAEVVKVESTSRPDGSRAGPPAFFDWMNAGKRSVALDFADPADVARLRRLVARADVVIEGSRPRALAQLGIDPMTPAGGGRPRVWVSITGHGRTGPNANRVGFGDDAAVAGGLVVWEGDQPRFCVDAAADPIAGLAAAVAAAEALATGGRWLIDVSLASAAAGGAGPTLDVAPELAAAEPVAPTPGEAGPRLGEHTGAVLHELDDLDALDELRRPVGG